MSLSTRNHFRGDVNVSRFNLSVQLNFNAKAQTECARHRAQQDIVGIPRPLQGGDGGRSGGNVFSGGEHLYSLESGAGKTDSSGRGTVEALSVEQLPVVFEPCGKRIEDLPKGAAEKTVLAWWLRGRTGVTLRWVSERLKMGHYTRVPQAMSRMRRRPGRNLKQMQRKLVGLASEQE